MKKVLVIGATGFAGRHVVEELRGRDVELTAVGHRTSLPENPGLRVIRGGIRALDAEMINEMDPDTVFHLARPKFPVLRKPGRVLAARWAAIQNRRLMQELARATHPPKLVFASGSLMYGSSTQPQDENAPLNPSSFARQYFRGEVPILDAVRSAKVPGLVIRLPWLLGNGSWFEWFYLEPMRRHRTIPLFGSGDNFMEIIDIQDAAKLMVRLAAEPAATGVVNLVTSGAITQLDFASVLSSVSGLPVKDYRDVFPGHPEKEAIEAFTSNIILMTKYPELTAGYQYLSLEETLKRLTEGL